MNPTDAPPAAPSAPDFVLDGYLEAFEAAFARDGSADPADFLPPPGHPRRPEVVRELVRVDLEFAWDRGDERRVEHYRGRFPELFADADGLRGVAWEEFRLRQAAGETPTPEEYRARLGIDLFSSDRRPGRLPSTRRLADAAAEHDFSADGVYAPTAVGPGAVVCGFEVRSELGRGAFGRVFLAREPGLAGRPVVLKVSAKRPGESQTLARLQHTNIVPVYSVHRHGPMHVICMPYLGATTLADLLDAFRGAGGPPESGKGLVTTLADRAARVSTAADAPASRPGSDAAPRVVPAEKPPTGLSRDTLARLERLTYVETVLWLGAQLADGLAHAHDRGVLHRDLKPANVLLTDDGRPMLLDFNLAADEATDPDSAAHAGGTLRYMPPEALAALAAGTPHADPRADVYGLGLILFELLAGTSPFRDPPAGPMGAVIEQMWAARLALPPTAGLRTDVTPAVMSILATCLDPDPANRYPSAAALRDDLQRQLDSRPLAFAPERSWRERASKWCRRHPRLSSSTTIGVVAAALLAVGASVFLHRQRTLDRLEAGEKARAARDAHDVLRGWLPSFDIPVGVLDPAEQAARAALAPFAALDGPGWVNGELVRRLPEEERDAVRHHVAAVLVNLATVLGERARHEPDAGRRADRLDVALRVNERAADHPSVAGRVQVQRVRLLELAGRPAEPADATDEESRIRALLKAGRYREAADRLRVRCQPGNKNYDEWLYLGDCYRCCGEPGEALRCYDVAAMFTPDTRVVRLQRGKALHELRRFADALAEYDAALAAQPDFPEALLCRALARVERKDAAGAIADLDTLEALGAPFARLYFVRAHARRLAGDAAGADRDLRTGFARQPTEAQSWLARGRERLHATPPDPQAALADYEKAVALDPHYREAWEHIAEVFSEHLRRPDDSLRAQEKALELAPGNVPLRAGRAVLLARLGRREESRKEAELCLEGDADALVHYQTGCVYLITAAGPADRDRGLGLLRAALRKDPTWAKMMPTDPDLRSVHASDEFQALVTAAGVLAR